MSHLPGEANVNVGKLVPPQRKIHKSALLNNRIVPLCSPSANYTVSDDNTKVNCRVCLDKAKFYE